MADSAGTHARAVHQRTDAGSQTQSAIPACTSQEHRLTLPQPRFRHAMAISGGVMPPARECRTQRIIRSKSRSGLCVRSGASTSC
eukprot:4580397-Pleurochrysis_carterae.AAC.1